MLGTRLTNTLLATTILALATAPPAHAQAFGRIVFTVLDQDESPVRDAQITVTTPALGSFEVVETTNKRGRVIITLNDTTVIYAVRVDKEGFEPVRAEIQPELGETVEKTFKLAPAGQAAASTTVVSAQERADAMLGAKKIRLYNEGVEAQQAGDLATARAKFQESADTDSDYAPAYTGMAIVAAEQGDYAAAAGAAEKALALDPEDYRALKLRYDAYRNLGDARKAEQAAKELRKAGDVAEVANRVFNEGVEAFKAGDVELAKARFQQAVELDPEMVAGYANLAQIYLHEKDAERAAAMAAEALERHPDDLTTLKVEYDARTALGDTDGAAQTLERIVALDPQWAGTNLLDHAKELFNANQIPEARVALEELLAAQPDNARAHYLLALCLNSSGEIDAAKSHLQRFLELAPDDPEAPTAREILSYLP